MLRKLELKIDFEDNPAGRLYSYDRLFYSLYGYDGGTTRTYKYSFNLNPNWVNGRLESVSFNLHNAMFYPNNYLNFNANGYYTKHYYNGMERIASRLGDQNLSINVSDPDLQDRKDRQDSLIRKNVTEITGYQFLPVGEEQNHEYPKPVFELPQVGLNNLTPNTSSVYYYHPNHLGSTCYVTDENAIVQQGFLYAPFGEITNEHNSSFGNNVIPKYSFNAKELDEETGMYYYEARYMAPPVFISRDPLFEKYPTFSPYAYCANNPVKYIDPDGREIDDYTAKLDGTIEKKVTNDNFDRFFVEKSDGQVELIAQLNKVKAADGSTTLVEFPDKGTGFTRYGEADIGGDHYVQPMVAAALFGAVYAIYSQDPTITIQFGDMSGAKGNKPGTAHTGGKYSHINGKNVDLRYVRIDRANKPVTVNDAEFDWTANQNVVNAFKLFGFSDILSYPTADGKKQLANTRKLANHHHHIHLQGFNKKPTIVQ